jgi:DNA modification methylase
MDVAFEIKDFSAVYDSIMQFNKNKSVSIHQWYPFVEGYSREFIESILNEIDYTPNRVLEPFSGSGTTALELQHKDIECISFEVSPFMHLLSSVKLYKGYNSKRLKEVIRTFKENLLSSPKEIRQHQEIPFGKTVVKRVESKKWNFNDEALDGILDIKFAIKKINEPAYENLFKIVLASILLEVSNLFRNGKCLSYKKDWNSRPILSRAHVHKTFLDKLENLILRDILALEETLSKETLSNYPNLHFGDVRSCIKNVPDDSIDLIITSPPYLNSRDYTDIYMLELKVLDLIKNYEELSNLRRNTLRSHVQVKYGTLETLDIPTLKAYLEKVSTKQIGLWNNDLLNMIRGYFLDMEQLFIEFKRVMLPNKFIYFNVANSAYFGEEIIVDQIISEIAVKLGFKLVEIRKARNLKASSQQSGTIRHLRESVIIFKS